MRIKSYFANSVQEAIENARAELGSDAMLLNSKKTEWELRSLGSYEVVFGVSAEERTHATSEETKPVAAGAAEDLVRSSEVVKELAGLRKEIETVRRSVARHGRFPGGGGVETEEIRARLAAADFSDEFANEIAEAVERQMISSRIAGAQRSDGALRHELERRLAVEARLGSERTETRAVAFVGPAGAGKTSSLIKLAIRYGLRGRQPLQILSLDTLRVGGWEQLAAYARIAGLAFDVVHNSGMLGEALEEYAGKKLILVDTPGFSPAECRDMRELPAGVEVQLVLPAVLGFRAAQRTLERFRPLRPAKLLFTHWDEVESPGAPLEVAMRSGLPVSFLGSGQQIPEDIREADKSELLAHFTARESREQSAASAA